MRVCLASPKPNPNKPRTPPPKNQTDYWDSINLQKGQYAPVPLLEGVKDFLGQLSPGSGPKAQQAMNAELPYELLRRSGEYEVRRYPAFEGAVWVLFLFDAFVFVSRLSRWWYMYVCIERGI